MNRTPSRRFNRGLSSGLSILAVLAVGYSLGGEIKSVNAADNPPSAAADNSQVSAIDIPGTFKNLPDSKDAVTAKRPVEDFKAAPAATSQTTELAVDPNKGISKGSPNESDGELQDFHATAYCIKGRTASGAPVQPGVIAADPSVLPIGTVVHLRAGRYTGTYTVLDTGSRIKGRIVDVYVPSYQDAREFGRRQVKIKVISRGRHKANNK